MYPLYVALCMFAIIALLWVAAQFSKDISHLNEQDYLLSSSDVPGTSVPEMDY